MAREKKSVSFPFGEVDKETQQMIEAMSPEEREDFMVFTEMFEELPEEVQTMMLEVSTMLNQMPEDEREAMLEHMQNMASELADEDFDGDDFDEEDEDTAEHTEHVYPRFLPRVGVRKFTLRVALRGIKPTIYRKFNVPSNISLRHLSELIIDLMGWENCHLNQFRKGDNYYAPAYQREGEDDFMMGWGRARNYNQEDYALSDLLSEKGKTVEWEYDFGDSWYHEIRLSSIGDYEESEPLVTFVKGEHQCPPEDCGGVWGYLELLELHAKRKSRKRLTADEKDRLEWYDIDKDYDPTHFDQAHGAEVCEWFCM